MTYIIIMILIMVMIMIMVMMIIIILDLFISDSAKQTAINGPFKT